jgi:hypothetical protein
LRLFVRLMVNGASPRIVLQVVLVRAESPANYGAAGLLWDGDVKEQSDRIRVGAGKGSKARVLVLQHPHKEKHHPKRSQNLGEDN